MYVVTVVPVERKGVPESLTFFAREAPQVGSIIDAPIRSRTIPALVTDVSDASESKLDLKTSTYALRKIESGTSRQILSRAFIRAVDEVSAYHVTPRGHTLAQCTFRSLLVSASSIPSAPEHPTLPGNHKVHVLVADIHERFAQYRNMARRALAEKHTLLIIAPSLIEVEEITAMLSRGISEHVVSLSSNLTAHQIKEAWTRAVTSEARIVVGTPAALSCPLPTPCTIVLERESARTYRSRNYPFIDTRRLAHALAQQIGARLVLADYPLRAETQHLLDTGDHDDAGHTKLRPQSTAQIRVVRANENDEKSRFPRTFHPFGPESARALATTIDARRNAIVFASRKGIAPLTVCGDCGMPVVDPITKTPMSLHRSINGNVYLSHRTGETIPALAACKSCGGWNLVTLGIGVERAFDELVRFIPREKVVLFTSDTAPTHAKAKQLLTTFTETEGAVLVGTERMIPYITKQVALTVVASIDSMLALPQWRADEYALRTLISLRERTEELMIVETRRSDHPVMTAFESGDTHTFYRALADERRAHRYPPFTTFIGLTWSGTEDAVRTTGLEVTRALRGVDLVGPLTPEVHSLQSITARALVRAPQWPDAHLQSLLLALPEEVVITVDPEEIV